MKRREKESLFIFVREILIIISFVIFLVFYKILPNIADLEYVQKVEKVQKELKELRIAIEEYYQLTGEYPNLSAPGVCDNLILLDYIDKEGRKISFAKIYKKNKIGVTQASKNISFNNRVFDNNDFKKINGLAGWNYDYSGKTGEIHANLKSDTYFQEINWSEE